MPWSRIPVPMPIDSFAVAGGAGGAGAGGGGCGGGGCGFVGTWASAVPASASEATVVARAILKSEVLSVDQPAPHRADRDEEQHRGQHRQPRRVTEHRDEVGVEAEAAGDLDKVVEGREPRDNRYP